MKALFLSILLFCLHLKCFPQNNTIDPYKYIATFEFDGEDFFDSGESNFPQSFRFNTTQDANSDGTVNVEDNLENLIPFAIGNYLYGTGRSGLTNRGPNDQRPSVYFHLVKRQNYDVYEYWLYYADNDWLNDHEHDWEKYFVYVKDTTPVYIYISWHTDFNLYSWCEISKDDGHPIINVNGGSHAMEPGTQDGVVIRYNGEITKNNGRLDYGDLLTIPWLCYSNDFDVLNGISYIQSPDTFYYGDPEYLTNSNEWGDARDAPWKRDEWDNPPVVSIVNLGADKTICSPNSVVLDAGSGFSSYLWSDGSTGQTITVSTTGIYYVEVSDNFGCTHSDTVEVFVTILIPDAGFDYASTGLTVSFSDSSLNASDWLWYFGDVTPGSTVQNPIHTYANPGAYDVCLIATNACGSDTVCTTISVSETGISEFEIQSLKYKVYPNPSGGVFTIECQITLPRCIAGSNVNLLVYNILGKKIYESRHYVGTNDPMTIDLSKNPAGMYHLQVITNRGISNIMIIIE